MVHLAEWGERSRGSQHGGEEGRRRGTVLMGGAAESVGARACGLSGVRAVRERAGSGAKARRGRGLWAS